MLQIYFIIQQRAFAGAADPDNDGECPARDLEIKMLQVMAAGIFEGPEFGPAFFLIYRCSAARRKYFWVMVACELKKSSLLPA